MNIGHQIHKMTKELESILTIGSNLSSNKNMANFATEHYDFVVLAVGHCSNSLLEENTL